MKKLIIEIRMWMAEKLLSWSSRMAPNTPEGQGLKFHIWRYFANLFYESKASKE
jgi:hypothetical protein